MEQTKRIHGNQRKNIGGYDGSAFEATRELKGNYYTSISLNTSTGEVSFGQSTSSIYLGSGTTTFYSRTGAVGTKHVWKKSGNSSWSGSYYTLVKNKELVSSTIDLSKNYGLVYGTNEEEYEEEKNINSYYYVYEGIKQFKDLIITKIPNNLFTYFGL